MPTRVREKAARTLRLLLGLRHPPIAGALAAYGFTEADMLEGWALLKGLGTTRFDPMPPPSPNAQTIPALHAWENTWFPIARGALAHLYPVSKTRLFLNLSPTTGPEIAVTVHVFLDRFDAMSKGEGAFDAEGIEAAKLLLSRGMNAAVIAEARTLLKTLCTVAEPSVPLSTEKQKGEAERAEAALWAWYIDWSQVARVAIKQPTLLRQLGLLRERRRKRLTGPERGKGP